LLHQPSILEVLKIELQSIDVSGGKTEAQAVNQLEASVRQ